MCGIRNVYTVHTETTEYLHLHHFKCGPTEKKNKDRTGNITMQGKMQSQHLKLLIMKHVQSEFDEAIVMVYEYWPSAFG